MPLSVLPMDAGSSQILVLAASIRADILRGLELIGPSEQDLRDTIGKTLQLLLFEQLPYLQEVITLIAQCFSN